MLQKLMDYDPAKGAEYATYIYPFIWDSMLRFRICLLYTSFHVLSTIAGRVFVFIQFLSPGEDGIDKSPDLFRCNLNRIQERLGFLFQPHTTNFDFSNRL